MMYSVTHTYRVWREIDLMENIIWYTYLFMFFSMQMYLSFCFAVHNADQLPHKKGERMYPLVARKRTKYVAVCNLSPLGQSVHLKI